MTMTPLVVCAVGIVVVSLATAVLRRSLLAGAAALGQASLALAALAMAQGRVGAAVVVAGTGLALVTTLCAVAVAVHRRRGSDHVDELRELQG
jgi:hypothetical protein